MKSIMYTLLMLLIPSVLSAQTTVMLPANTLTFSTDTTYHFMPGGGTYHVHVCSGAHVTLTGFSTYMGRFFLEENASLTLDDTMNFYVVADVYMKKNSTYDFNHKAGSINDTIIAELPVSLIDTGTAVFTFLTASPLLFDYTLLPGGVSPCSVVSSLTDPILSDQLAQIGNPFGNKLIIHLDHQEGKMMFRLTDTKGAGILCQPINAGKTEFFVPSLPQGIYFYEMLVDGDVLQRGKLLHE